MIVIPVDSTAGILFLAIKYVFSAEVTSRISPTMGLATLNITRSRGMKEVMKSMSVSSVKRVMQYVFR
jgi:hypothetical protein